MNLQQLKNYYEGISIIPCQERKKDFVDRQWNYKRYSINDFTTKNNIAAHTGSEIFKDTFLATLDLDYDTSKYWNILKQPVFNNFRDSVIVKTGGQHNGLHVHYLTPTPVRSSRIITKFGMTELKGIGDDGSPDAIMLPPSKVLTQYKVIHPYNGFYIDFQQVKKISVNELRNKILNFTNQIGIR